MSSRVPPVDEQQREFLRAVYDRYHADSMWPPMRDLHRQLTQDGRLEVYKAGQKIDPHYLLPHIDSHGGVALRLLGIREGRGPCEETNDYVTIVRLAVRRYTDKGTEPKIAAAELATTGIAGDRLGRFNLLLERTDFISGPQGTPDALFYEVHEGVDKYLSAETIDDVIAAFLRSSEGHDPRYGVPATAAQPSVDPRRVFVVHGRNGAAQKATVDLLRAFALEPVLFRDMLPDTGKATPYVGDVLERGFDSTYASVIVMTPDDEAQLRADLLRPRDPEYEKRLTGQARPNVLFEAGMGWSAHRGRTVILHLGSLRPLTDLEGLHVLRFDDTPGARRDVGLRLQTAGCPVDFSGDWLGAGDFRTALAATEQQPTPQAAGSATPPWDDAWLVAQRAAAHDWRQANGAVQSYMEAAFGVRPKTRKTLNELRVAAERAQVMTFGSSLAGVLATGDGAPKPTPDGIMARYAGEQSSTYWSLTKTGLGYLMHTNFEEVLFEGAVGVDTRIYRVTELLLHLRNLYTEFGASDDAEIFIEVRHGGLAGRALRFANSARVDARLLLQPVRAITDTSSHMLAFHLAEVRGDLRPLVKAILNPVFELFDFYEPAAVVYDEIVPAFVAGKPV